MSRAAERLHALNLINGYDVSRLAHRAGLVDVYIAYSPSDPFRTARWGVVSTGHHVDPHGHAADYGMKVFAYLGRQNKQAALERAQAWASERYGVSEWVQIPGVAGAPWFPAEVAAHVKQLLKDAS
jgi:hypothetical protein